MEIIKKLGYQAIVDYVISKSKLTKDQFTFITGSLMNEDGYMHIFKTTTDLFFELGRFDYNRFIKEEGDYYEQSLFAITKFLDLCIKKFEDHSIIVPVLSGNPDDWDECYKKSN